jgi:BirA family transcriptional regulator, biotin operon repressor / biotin---[acetyl-CoA-carboxylase] ligase
LKSSPLSLPRERLGRIGSTAVFFDTVGSTNDVAASIAADGGHEGAVVVADQQTAGRGRRGRSWFSPAGSGIYASVVLVPARARADPMRATRLLTLAAGVALGDAVQSETGLIVDLKWPNDLYVGRRKLAGILAEAPGRGSAVGAIVLGFGINLRPSAYPMELADRATSLESELGRPVDGHAMLVAALIALGQRYDDLLDARFDAILDAWRHRAPAAHGARVTWNIPSGRQSGITSGIDDDGALLVRVADAVERIVGGEVHWDV